MDVRCDRCQTEYELEDESVSDGGASVQCTSCGHTFVVSRGGRSSSTTPTPGPTPGPATASVGTAPPWMLTTEEGKTHRFRDSTTLQKWIVERRVGRADRVCPPGGSWRRLGEMDELRPFFEVVDQADRAAAARDAARPTRPETPRRLHTGGRPYASPDEDDDDVLTADQRARGSRGRSAYPGRFNRTSPRRSASTTACRWTGSVETAAHVPKGVRRRRDPRPGRGCGLSRFQRSG